MHYDHNNSQLICLIHIHRSLISTNDIDVGVWLLIYNPCKIMQIRNQGNWYKIEFLFPDHVQYEIVI